MLTPIPAPLRNLRRIRLSNGTSVQASFVAAVTLADETNRVFLKNGAGDTLCSIRCDSEEAALAEIANINQQMGW